MHLLCSTAQHTQPCSCCTDLGAEITPQVQLNELLRPLGQGSSRSLSVRDCVLTMHGQHDHPHQGALMSSHVLHSGHRAPTVQSKASNTHTYPTRHRRRIGCLPQCHRAPQCNLMPPKTHRMTLQHTRGARDAPAARQHTCCCCCRACMCVSFVCVVCVCVCAAAVQKAWVTSCMASRRSRTLSCPWRSPGVYGLGTYCPLLLSKVFVR